MQRKGTKPYTYDTYAGPVAAWTWLTAAREARRIAELRASRGESAVSVVTERATGRKWMITPESDLLVMEAELLSQKIAADLETRGQLDERFTAEDVQPAILSTITQR